MSRRSAFRMMAYGLAAAGGIIYGRQWDHLAVIWAVLVVAYVTVIFDGRLAGPATGRPRP
ncbi:MAG: hypothetical protein F9K29_17125 [Hyphomicrobiaceae bacterium]|nr:MAG: hypothetical protein F9K29_17125 [Hyphomicrobiaceae bacterium]